MSLARIGGPAPGLFRAHIVGGSHDGSGDRVDPLPCQGAADLRGQILFCEAGVEEFGQPEVEELGMAVPGDHDVVGLDVPVDDVRLVGPGQAFGDLVTDLDGALEVELALGDQAADGPAFDVLHGNEHRAVGLVDVIDRGDGWMGDGRGGLGLDQEAAFAHRVGDELGLEKLQGDGPLELGVARPIDDTHAAHSQEALRPCSV